MKIYRNPNGVLFKTIDDGYANMVVTFQYGLKSICSPAALAGVSEWDGTYHEGDLVRITEGVFEGTIAKVEAIGNNRIFVDWYEKGSVHSKWDFYQFELQPYFPDNDAPAAPAPKCDCGGWAVGAHSAWCSNPNDNAKRKKGLGT